MIEFVNLFCLFFWSSFVLHVKTRPIQLARHVCYHATVFLLRREVERAYPGFASYLMLEFPQRNARSPFGL
jgi:hypothetical protein